MISVVNITAMRLEGFTIKEIAKQFGVSRQHITQRIHADKKRARDAVRNAVKSGKLVRPDSCSKCGTVGKVQGHHHDYSKPLEVKWVCRECHFDEPVPRIRTPLNPETRDRLKSQGALNPLVYVERFAPARAGDAAPV